MIDVAAEVGEALLVVPEPLEELVGDALAELAQLDRLFGDAFLEGDHVAPCGRAGLPDRGRAFEGAVLVEQGMPKSRLARNAPHRGFELPGDEFEDRRLAGAVASDDAPPLALGDGEGDVLEEFGRAEGDADVGEREKGHAETEIGRDGLARKSSGLPPPLALSRESVSTPILADSPETRTVRRMRTFSLCLVVAASASRLAAQSVTDTRLLTQTGRQRDAHRLHLRGRPLDVATSTARDVRRLTTADGDEQNPVFSPDGSAHRLQRQVRRQHRRLRHPAAGGTPKRLTWHPDADIVQGFTPDGKNVLFTSGRSSLHQPVHRSSSPCPIDGGAGDEAADPQRRSRDRTRPTASGSPTIRSRRAFDQWKHYRGGAHVDDLVVRRRDARGRESPAARRAQQRLSTRSGSATRSTSAPIATASSTSTRYDAGTKKVKRSPTHTDFPVAQRCGAAPARSSTSRPAISTCSIRRPRATDASSPIGVAADLRETRPRFVKGANYVRNVALSPSGVRAAFEFRGEIVTVPAEKGDARNLTNTTGAHERSPAWSPDGSQIAYISDASGEYELQDPRRRTDAARRRPSSSWAPASTRISTWSPDGTQIAYVDNSMSTYVIDVKTGVAKLVGQQQALRAGRSRHDARVVARLEVDRLHREHQVTRHRSSPSTISPTDKSYRVTDGLSDVSTPVFDKSGKYLYIFASTDAGPVQDWFSLATADYRRTRSIYAIVLRERPPATRSRRRATRRRSSSRVTPRRPIRRAPTELAWHRRPADAAEAGDVASISTESRIGSSRFPIGSRRSLAALQAGDAGQIYYVAARRQTRGPLHHYDLSKRKDEILIPQLNGYEISADAKKVLYNAGNNFFVSRRRRSTAGEGRLAIADVEVKIDPRAEWTQIFNEAWRINRDYFYAPNMHGVNWEANRKKYAQFLPDAVDQGRRQPHHPVDDE